MAYYVKIESPKEFRRDVLESSKMVIGCLKGHRSVSIIRDRKKKLMQELLEDLKEIVMLTQQLDKMMPERQLREEALREAKEEKKKVKITEKEANKMLKRVPKTAKTVKKGKTVKEPEKKPMEGDKLNEALTEIESKLSGL